MICVSKCLLGENCRYYGSNTRNEKVIEYLKDKEYVSVCPECLGGLDIPRDPSVIVGDHVFSCVMQDVTRQYHAGAKEALKIAQENNCTVAIFQENSPSCGSKMVYDGSFTGNKIPGKGITTKLFEENGIKVISSTEF